MKSFRYTREATSGRVRAGTFSRGCAASPEAGTSASSGWADGETAGLRRPVPVPAPLASWFTARLDRVGESREVARAASVLGREFTLEQLSTLLPGAGDAVERGVARLVEDEIFRRRSDRLGGRCRFRYALDRSAAYASLLAQHRRLYEERASAARSSTSSSRASTQSGSSAPSVNQP